MRVYAATSWMEGIYSACANDAGVKHRLVSFAYTREYTDRQHDQYYNEGFIPKPYQGVTGGTHQPSESTYGSHLKNITEENNHG